MPLGNLLLHVYKLLAHGLLQCGWIWRLQELLRDRLCREINLLLRLHELLAQRLLQRG